MSAPPAFHVGNMKHPTLVHAGHSVPYKQGKKKLRNTVKFAVPRHKSTKNPRPAVGPSKPSVPPRLATTLPSAYL